MSGPKILLTTSTTSLNFIQLGIHYVKSYADRYIEEGASPKIHIRVFTPKNTGRSVEKYEIDRFVQMICKKRWDLIGFSCYVWNIDFILDAIKIIKKLRPDTKIVLGGPEVTYRGKSLMEETKAIDYIVRYEGEATFLDLLKYLFYNNNSQFRPETILGLIYRNRNNIVQNPDREPLKLESVPSPYLDGSIKINSKTVYNLETSRGCPFKCAYCSFPLSGQKRVRYFPLEKVKKEIKLLAQKNISRLEINDDNFNLNLHRAKEIMKIIIQYRLHCYLMMFLNLSAMRIDKEFVSLLKKQGDSWPSIGVQSTRPSILKTIRRVSNILFLEKNLQLLVNAGIPHDLQFIIGLPDQTFQDIKTDLNWAFAQKSPHVTFFKLWLTNGTHLYEKASEFGYVYQKSPPHSIIRTPFLSARQLKKAVRMTTVGRLLILPQYRSITAKIMTDLKMDFASLCEDLIRWGDFKKKDKRINLKSYIVYKYMSKQMLKKIISN